MEIDDNEIKEIEEFEKDSGNRISINFYGTHIIKILKTIVEIVRLVNIRILMEASN